MANPSFTPPVSYTHLDVYKRQQLEYGMDSLEIQEGAFEKGAKVAIVDDLLATGGTVNATAKLVEKMGGEVMAMEFLIELTDLKGKEKNKEYKVDSLIQYNI